MSQTEINRKDDGAVGRHPLMTSKNRLKLGCFSWNLQRGSTATLAEGSIAKLDWAQQQRIAIACEAAGLDAIIPVGRWKGIGGPSRFWCESYETTTWAAALAAVTEHISIFSTVHVPLFHPVRAAKTGVTIDHISGGRFGFNIVAGWNAAEFGMFGKPQRAHDERYKECAEWIHFVQKLWESDTEFDWQGEYYQATAAINEPRPLGPRPVLMSAGSSPAGRAFAAEHVDIIFVVASSLPGVREAVRETKAHAAKRGRDVQVWTIGGMLCAPTEAEARRQYDDFVHQKGDWEAAAALTRSFAGGGGQSLTEAEVRAGKEGVIAWTHGYQLIGTPEQVAEKMQELTDAGLDGMALCYMDYEGGLQIFREEVRPLAQQRGLMA